MCLQSDSGSHSSWANNVATYDGHLVWAGRKPLGLGFDTLDRRFWGRTWQKKLLKTTRQKNPQLGAWKSPRGRQVLRSQDLTIAVVTTGFLVSIYLLGFYLGPALELYEGLIISCPSWRTRQLNHSVCWFCEWGLLNAATGIRFSNIFCDWRSDQLDGFCVSALAPKISKLNPIKGLERIFGLKALVELIKSILKFLLVGGIATIYFYANYDQIVPYREATPLPRFTQNIFCSIRSHNHLLLPWPIAAIDVPYQRYDFIKKLKMSKQE